MMESIIYLVAVLAAEIITVYLDPLWGMIIHVAIMAAVLVRSSLFKDPLYQKLFLGFALVPLVRIISLSMGLGSIPQIWWYPIIYAPLVVASFVVVRFSGYSLKSVGLNRNKLLQQLLIALSGVVFGFTEYFILFVFPSETLVAPLPDTYSVANAVWMGLILLVTTGFVEEFMFRGVLQKSACDAWGWWGIIFVSLLFAILHIGFKSPLDVAFVMGVALFFGWMVKKTGSLLGVTLAHGITNTLLFVVLPFFI